MTYEYELYFGGEDPYMTITPLTTTCVTELMNMAHRMAREQKAIHVSFGPVIERGDDGLPKVEKRR